MSLVKDIAKRQEGLSSFLNLKQQLLLDYCKRYKPQTREWQISHKSAVNSIDLDISGRYLLSGAKNGTLLMHDLLHYTSDPGYKCLFSCNSGVSIDTVQWYPFDSGMFTSSGMDHSLRLWDTVALNMVDHFRFSGKIYHHHISPVPMGTWPLIAVATSSPQVFLVDMRRGHAVHELRGHTASVMCCAWSPVVPHYLASGSCDSTIRLWDTRSTGGSLGVLDFQNRNSSGTKNSIQAHNGFVNGVAFTPNGRLLMSTGTDNKLCCWDFHTQKHQGVVYENLKIRKNKSTKFQVFGYGKMDLCFVPSDSNIIILEIKTGKILNILSGHYNWAHTCCLQRETLELYSGGQDQSILFWTRKEHLGDSTDTKDVKIIKVELDNWSDDEG